MILSSLNPNELQQAIATENVNLIKSIKGIGLKTAQRLIVDLKDKIAKANIDESIVAQGIGYNSKREEASMALIMLGFQKTAVEKELDKILNNNPTISVEELIKTTLRSI
jgi:holliday junction DNA helicase RuvA